jgi:hypothetical protein
VTTPTQVYRQRMTLLQAGVLLWLASAWQQQYDRAQPLGSLSLLGQASARAVAGAQQAAALEAAAWLRALTARAAGATLSDIPPYRVPPVAGSSAAGIPLSQLTGLAPAVYLSRLAGGASEDEAARASAAWLGRVAASEPYRAANTTVYDNARSDQRLTGRARRQTRPGACAFCADIAARGFTGAGTEFRAHAHCRCIAEPEISPRYLATQRAGGTAVAEGESGYMPPEREYRIVSRPPPLEPYLINEFDEADTAKVRSALQRSFANIRPDVVATDHDGDGPSLVAVSQRKMPKSVATASGLYQPGVGTIRIAPGISGPDEEVRSQFALKHGWWPKIENTTGIEYSVVHETGHFLDDNLTRQQKARVRLAAHGAGAYNERRISAGLSEYGSKNDAEMVAEGWAEYILSDSPRPIAKAIGDSIVSILGVQ